MSEDDEDKVVDIGAGLPIDPDIHIRDLESNFELHEDFGDPESLMNSRDWLEEAITAKGAKIHGSGVGMGRADLDIELEGHEYIVSIKPRLAEKS